MNNLLLTIWNDAFIICGLGMVIVFAVLIVLVIILNLFSAIMTKKIRIPKKSNNNESIHIDDFHEIHLSTTESAAIAAAIHLYYYNDIETEKQQITIKNIERRYSPWSSKIYGINNLVR